MGQQTSLELLGRSESVGLSKRNLLLYANKYTSRENPACQLDEITVWRKIGI